ncbi:hypothetical protein GOODEAATRI_018033 [Goodea atripinnis]|uniref:Uncharacterized protein n=1 Tax=Goodea atripinnis TaxID=208336 RepID=A0ABV0NPI7_9TELE
MGERRPWTGRQSITQTTTHTLIHTPKGNLERPINLTGMSLDCGRKPEYRENMQTPCRKTPGRESNPGPSCCKATVLKSTANYHEFLLVLLIITIKKIIMYLLPMIAYC